MNRANMLESTCRICSSQHNNLISVLGEDGIQLNLPPKIEKYLNITILPTDKFPKTICVYCCKKLNAIHKFATMALNVQTQFANILNYCDNEKSVNCLNNDQSLLYSHLSKESVLMENETDVTEMEVRIDPLLYLECLNDESNDEELFRSDSSDLPDSPPSSPQNVASTPEEHDADCSEISDNSNVQSAKVFIESNRSSEIQRENVYHLNSVTITPSISTPQCGYTEKLEKNLICTICEDHFSNDAELKTHLWSHLLNENRKVLTVADNSINNTEIYNNNYSKENDITFGENLNTILFCPVCGKHISTKGNLKVHLETHKPKGKYECDKCGRIFKTESNLFRHKEYHEEVQFSCDVCGRVYPTKSTLRAHSITHSDLRPHKCPLCNKTFKRNQDLKFHINQHTGARPYQCLYCPKAFASSGNCFSHRKRMHPQELERDRERVDQIVQ